MILTNSYKVHAVDEKKNGSLCGHVVYLEPDQKMEGLYTKVTCKSCQWIIENELKTRFGS